MDQKTIRNYILTGTVIFLLSIFSMYYHYSIANAAPCLNNCNVQVTKRLSNTLDSTDTSLYISITRSTACKLDNCVSEKYLVKNYDTSDQYISGKFVEKNGDLTRKKAFFGKSLDLYKSSLAKKSGTVVFVSPDLYTWIRTKQIIIEPSLHNYIFVEDMIKKEIDFNTDKRIIRHQVYVKGCEHAVIGWNSNGTANLPLVLEHFKNNCKDELKIPEMVETILTKKSSRDFCGKVCNHEKWKEQAKKQSKNTFLLNPNIKLKGSNMTIGVELE